MTAVWMRFRAELRTRGRAWLGLAVLVGVASGAVMALAAGARRTDSAYRRFLEAQDAYDVLVSLNTFGFGAPTQKTFNTEELRRLPQVAETAETGSFFITRGAGVGVLVPPDERIGTEINRFKMLEGRRPKPDDPTEAVVGFEFAEQYGVEVGSEIEVIEPSFFGEPPPELTPEDVSEIVAARDRVLSVLPDNALTIVGIEAAPGEFPPQIEGTGRYLIHASPALYPLREDLAVFSESSDLLMVRLENGEADTHAFLADLERLGAREGVQLTVQRELTDIVDRSLSTQAVALQLLALLTAIAGLLIVGQLLARLTFLESTEHPVLSALGMTPGQRFALGLARAAAVGLGGAIIAIAVAIALSPAFPTGLAGTAEPHGGLHVDATVLGVGALGIAVVVVLIAGWPAWRMAHTVTAGAPIPPRLSVAGRVLAGAGASLPVSTGVRMALEPGSGRSSVPVRSGLVGVTLGIITLVGALTFGASLGHLLSTPELYGQTWDVELTTYDDSLVDRGLPLLEQDDRVAGAAVGDFRASLEVNDRRVDGLVLDTVHGDLSPVIIEGRTPEADDEIALGTRTLRAFDAAVGDVVDVAPFATARDPVPMRVVGRAVFPIFGEAGRLGDGSFVTSAGWERVLGEPLDLADTGMLLRLAPGASVDAVVEDLEAALETTVFVIEQGTPTDIVNFGRVEATPYLLGGILALLSAATLTHLLATAIRRRRRDLAILKTLGFVRRQVASTVAWQATAVVVVGLLVGLPVGIALGRWAWRLMAENLGVVPEPQVPVAILAVLVGVALLLANAIAFVPGLLAARTRAATVLRTE